jgi:hypothetical protein
VGGSQSALAQAGACGAITFGPAVLSQFPEAPAACLGVETRDGQQFAHFRGEIRDIRGSQVRARFELPGGGYSKTYSFNPSREARVTIRGQRLRYSELQPGQELSIYLPADRWEFNVPETETLAAAQTVERLTPAVDTSGAVAAAPTLPRTAAPLPLLGLLGGLLTALGVGLSVVRRRFF